LSQAISSKEQEMVLWDRLQPIIYLESAAYAGPYNLKTQRRVERKMRKLVKAMLRRNRTYRLSQMEKVLDSFSP
jgi:hypothetical protein